MQNPKSGPSKITKIGPMFKIEGGLIFKHPFRSRPLKGFDPEDNFKNSDEFLNDISKRANNWFSKFPNCCSSHKELATLNDFNKSDFNYIPDQILNNIKFFGHALEKFLDEENGMQELKDYLDYLIESFGRPDLGAHIFLKQVKHFITNGFIYEREFTDDQRLELLEHLEPTKPPIDLDQRDLDILFSTYQRWLDAMPNIGKFKEIKQKLEGKIPMNLFMVDTRYNKYLQMSTSKTRSKDELLAYLIKFTSSILKLSKDEFNKESFDKEKLIIAAEERLRIKQNKLFKIEKNQLETNYFELIENWLSNVIEFYSVISQVIEMDNSEILIENVTNIDKTLISLENWKQEMSQYFSSDKSKSWLEFLFKSEQFRELLNELNSLNEQQNKEILESIKPKVSSKPDEDFKEDLINEKLSNATVSVKNKIQVSLPIFLFTKLVSEVELSDSQKIPRTLKELRKLFLK